MSKLTSQQADKFVVRLPNGMRNRLTDAALAQHASMNTIFIQALEQFLDSQYRQQLLLDALAAQVNRLEQASAPAGSAQALRNQQRNRPLA